LLISITCWRSMSLETDYTPGTTQVSLACFEARSRSYAVDVSLVREIVRSHQVTPLPSAPDLIDGVVELRGALVPVLDLGRVLAGDPSEVTSQSRIVVLDSEGLLMGLCVDAATDVLAVHSSIFEDVPDLATQAGYSMVRAVVRRESAPPVMVLSVKAIMEKVYRSALEPSGVN
jgi:purine-binding chemotaxis protein CheW